MGLATDRVVVVTGASCGAGKAAVDKMSHDMAVGFRPYNVAVISIWLGLLLTDINGHARLTITG